MISIIKILKNILIRLIRNLIFDIMMKQEGTILLSIWHLNVSSLCLISPVIRNYTTFKLVYFLYNSVFRQKRKSVAACLSVVRRQRPRNIP